MKKVLIATTVLVTVGLLSVEAQAADKVKLELGGFSKWFVVGAWNDPNFNKDWGPLQPTPGNVDVKGQSDITFSGSTKLDNGLDVGVFTALRAGTDTGINGDDQNNLIDRAYLYVASGYGKVIVGVLQNASHLLHVQAPESIGQWGEDGMLLRGQIIVSPADGINGRGANSTSILLGRSYGKAEGITYLTPTFYGLTLGGSYIPNDAKNVRGPVNTTQSLKDTFVVGANYTNSFGDVGVKTSFGWARTTYGQRFDDSFFGQSGQKVNAFNTGLNLSYGGFTLGGSFRWNVQDVRHGGLYGTDTLTGFSFNGYAWDAGLMYATGPWAASLSYFGSRMDGTSHTNQGKKEQISVVQASAKYTLGPGVDLQGLVGYGDFRAAAPDAQSVENGAVNRGWAVMTGVAVQF